MSKKNNIEKNIPAESVEAEKNAALEAEETPAEESAVQSEATAPKKAKKFNVRNFKHGTLSVVLTVVFIAVIVLVNVIVGLVSERFDTSADLSGSSIYSIDEKTEKFVKKLETDVTITVLNSEADFEAMGQVYKQVNEILKKMHLANERISIDYLVLDQNPNFSSKFKGETLEENYIVVECPETGRYRIIAGDSYITVDTEAYTNAYYAAYYSGASFNAYDYIYS
ncbi:MAG: Gldg family protein, partial [Oscillospiraceae bacterium]|nr:Gldg family protein [Oscillospiraceae bacterium]